MNSATCPQCGKMFSDPKHPNRIYCSNECVHLSQKRRPSRHCKKCGKPLDVKASSKKKYCSLQCAYQDRTGDPQSRETRTCQVCGKEFECWSYRATKYCSRECQHQAHRAKSCQIKKACEQCGQTYTIDHYFVTKRVSRYCSKQCMDEALSVLRQGSSNGNWKGGPQPFDYTRGPNWSAQRRKALKRDGYKCQICGRKKRVAVHHIIKWRTFNGNYLVANELSNLITLCPRCHNKVDRGNMPCPKRLL